LVTKWGNARKGAVNIASLENGDQKRYYLVYDRQGKMHMVKATLLKLQLKAEKEGQAHESDS
jgi:hypothetical protein